MRSSILVAVGPLLLLPALSCSTEVELASVDGVFEHSVWDEPEKGKSIRELLLASRTESTWCLENEGQQVSLWMLDGVPLEGEARRVVEHNVDSAIGGASACFAGTLGDAETCKMARVYVHGRVETVKVDPRLFAAHVSIQEPNYESEPSRLRCVDNSLFGLLLPVSMPEGSTVDFVFTIHRSDNGIVQVVKQQD